jgi:hypothetical protein
MRLGDFPLLIDDVRDPLRVFIFRRIRRAVREPDLPIGIAQQREGKVVLFGELRVGSSVIETDA